MVSEIKIVNSVSVLQVPGEQQWRQRPHQTGARRLLGDGVLAYLRARGFPPGYAGDYLTL